MTDLERIELAIRRAARGLVRNGSGHTVQDDIAAALFAVADEIAKSTTTQEKKP